MGFKEALLVDAFLPKQPALHRRKFSIIATYLAGFFFLGLLVLAIVQAASPPLQTTTNLKWSAGKNFSIRLTCLSQDGCWVAETYSGVTPGGQKCVRPSQCTNLLDGEEKEFILCASDYPEDGIVVFHNSSVSSGGFPPLYGTSVMSDMLADTGGIMPMPSALHSGTCLLSYVETHNNSKTAWGEPQQLRREWFSTLVSVDAIISPTHGCVGFTTGLAGNAKLVMQPYFVEVEVAQNYEFLQLFGRIGGLYSLSFSLFGALVAISSMMHLFWCPEKCWLVHREERESHPGVIDLTLDWRQRSMVAGLDRQNSAKQVPTVENSQSHLTLNTQDY